MKVSIFKSLYFQVLTAIAVGILLGHFWPELGAQMKPLGDAFVKLIKMIIAPVIFCTVVIGIAGMEDMKKVGKVGGIALLLERRAGQIAPQGWEFYAVTGTLFLTLAFPGFVYRYLLRRHD